jgi:hypothetical protein
MVNLIPKFNTSLVAKNKTAIVKADKFLDLSKSEKINPGKISKYTQTETGSEYNQELLLTIEKKVISIDKLLKDSLFLQRKDAETKRRKKEDKKFADKENELEKKQPKEAKGKLKLPSLPKLGLFDTIKNFIVNTFLGFLAVRLIDFLPQLLKIVPVIVKVGDFLIDIAGKMLDGLITIIDWGYKAIDATRGFVGKSFGDDALKNFDKLGGLIDTFLNLAIIAGMLSVGTRDTGPGLGKGKSGAKPKPGEGGRPKVTTNGGRSAGSSLDVRNPLRERPIITKGRGGRSGFRLPEFLGGKPKAKITTGGATNRVLLSQVRPFLKRIPLPVIGALIDFGLSVALGENPGRAAFRAIGAGLLGAVGAAAGTVVPVVGNLIGGLVGGYAGDSIGGILYDMFFNGKKPTQKQKTIKAAGGGSTTPSTRGGKRVNAPATRYIGGKKSTRSIAITPRKVKPGSKVGGKDKLEQIFPDTKNPSGNIITTTGSFIGNWISSLFGVKQPSQNTEDKKPKVPEKAPNPLGFLVKASDTLGKADFFGPMFSLATKTLLGDKPGKLDYLNVGVGLNSWLNQTMNFGGFAFAEGGEVDARNFMVGEDYSNVIAKSVENSVSGEVNQSIQDLMRQLTIQRVSPEEGDDEEMGVPGGGGGTGGQYSPTGLQGDIYRYLLSKGMDDNLALGIMANIHRESGFRPGASESGGPGVGLFQYSSGGRKSAFLKAVPNYATNWKGQIDYALKEDYAPQYLKRSFSSPQEAADVWMRKWERPAEYIQNDKGPKIHAQYLAGLQKYRTQKGYDIPGSNAVDIGLGKGYGSKGSKIAGDLGKYLNQNLIPGKDFLRVTEHPEFGGVVGGHAKNSYHKYGRAIDIGAWDWEQPKILKAIAQFNKQKGVKPVELLHAKNEPSGHSNHVHVAYKDGGETLDREHIAKIGEKGKEYVIDADSYKATEKVVPGLFDILNYDVNDKSSLIKRMPNIIASLSKYAPYESGAESTVVMPDTSSPASAGSSSGESGAPIISGGSVNRDMQFEDTLMYG